jgi:hypothetical protein
MRGNPVPDDFHTPAMYENLKNRLLTVMAKADPIPEDIILYRGLGAKKGFADQLKEGKIITDKGFLATSLDERVVWEFADPFIYDFDPTDIAVIFEIHTPRGTRAIPIRRAAETAEKIAGDIDMTLIRHQQEFVLPPGTRLRIKKVEKSQLRHPLLEEWQTFSH